MNESIAIVIPARLDSTRLPNKPLIEFNGIPMIVHVALKCAQVLEKELIFVSTPDDLIIQTCNSFGINTIKSSPEAKTGTDRLVEFSKKYSYQKIVNVQGDELLLSADCLQKFILNSKSNDNCTIGIVKILDKNELTKPSVVKVAISRNKLIYASRSQIPNQSYTSGIDTYKHTGLYMFTRDSLRQFSLQNQGPLEEIERIEILRFIENRIPVDVIEVTDYQFTIDTSEDVVAARILIE